MVVGGAVIAVDVVSCSGIDDVSTVVVVVVAVCVYEQSP